MKSGFIVYYLSTYSNYAGCLSLFAGYHFYRMEDICIDNGYVY